MTKPEQMLTKLKEEFKRWEDVLGSLNERQATTSRLPNGWSVKDLTAHLMAWQQVSVARLEAARLGGEPELPEWLAGASPEEAEADVDRFNARIDNAYQDQPWPWVHQQWRDGFDKF